MAVVLGQFLPCQLRLPSTCISHAVQGLQAQALPVAGLTLWLGTTDLSDHGPVIALQVHLGQWPSFSGLEYGYILIRI